MARQTIDLGTSPNKGDGDPLRIAFDKINDNFAELYAGDFADPSSVGESLKPDADSVYDLGSADRQWADLYVGDFIYLNGVRIEVSSGGALLVNGRAPAEVQDTVGSVFGDDSTLLVDGVNNIIPSANISGTEAANWDTAFLWGDHSAAGYLTDLTGDLQGSVFADDSTLLVDGLNGVIPTSVLQGDITNPIRTGNVVIESTTSPGSVTITHAGIGGITIDASTSADGISLEGNVSVEGSFTPPMLTQVEIDALTPTLGMMVYNTTTGKFQGYAADANNDSTTGWADLH